MTTETYDATYLTGEDSGQRWRLLLGDSCERLTELDTDSVDLSVCSPPFAQLYNYSPSPRDLSNSRSRGEFFEHYRYIIREQLRVTRPGRVAAIHVADITMQKVMHGTIGLTDFSGEVVQAFVDEGWIFDGRVTIDKDPQAQAIRTKSHSLLFVTKDRDSTMLRPALPDYLLKFRKPGDNPIPVKSDVSNEEWIAWARPVWLGIRETNTLNVRAASDDADERHICPLQLDFIARCIRLWSAPGELVLSPFAGIGSEGHVAIETGRRFLGIELKPSYWRTATANLRAAEDAALAPDLLSELAAA
ncbi:site-specific DNA-methyltransferase [Catellatospora sp. NPDC049609]|uniref:DNA-methyltransferase n=1 Tax=Catellatospora sp. NPDC049609 TaxID=3155505 RepID=UPI00341801BE